MAMRTRLTEILDIEHPVMLAGMGGVSYSRLVAAVSEAGGFGCLGASTMSAGRLVQEMAAVRAATAKPFGVDLLTAAPQDFEAKVRSIADAGASVYVAGLGVPREVVDLCHERNLLVVNMCGKVRHAVAAVEAGCDLVVAQGTEAGGHTGQVATLALVPQVVDAVGERIPVVAAGGIVDGRGLAAALALGADGVWVGTRFIATPEAQTVAGYKEALVALPEDGTVVTRAYTGKTCRVVRNGYTQRFDEAGGRPEPFPMQVLRSMEEGANHLGGDESTPGVDPDIEFYPAGQGAGAITGLVPAGDLVERFVRDAEEVLGRLTPSRA
ncbi:MAG: nitronate monooxygenase [Actinobacteria bacterium]|nr:nitronate monooxygenase [Actinomycetota bacterium]